MRVHYPAEVSAFKPRLSRDSFAGKPRRAGKRDKLGPFFSAHIHSWKSERGKKITGLTRSTLSLSLALSPFPLPRFPRFHSFRDPLFFFFLSVPSLPINAANKNNERPPASSASLFSSFSLEYSFAWWGLRWVGDVALNRKPPTRGYRTPPRVSFRNSSTTPLPLPATRPLTSRTPPPRQNRFCRWMEKNCRSILSPPSLNPKRGGVRRAGGVHNGIS